jgi:type VI secretion system protein ImpB
MAQDSSVAPKERVNIRFKPATGDAREEVELPHKLLVMGDFTLRADETPLAERARVSVNKDNFSDVMRSQDLKLDLRVPNRLSDDADDTQMQVSLKVSTLKDLEPEAIARSVPELRQLLELREALTALKGPLGNVPAFRKAIEAALGDEAARNKLLAELGAKSDQ